jgi:succinate-acetate transporter protein
MKIYKDIALGMVLLVAFFVLSCTAKIAGEGIVGHPLGHIGYWCAAVATYVVLSYLSRVR